MRRSRMLALGAVALALVSACGLGGGSKPTLKIGSVKFDEARVMAEIYAQVLEANGYTVDRAGIGLGERPIVAPAIESGQIDLQPEYIGSRLSYELKNNPNPAIPPLRADSAANLPACSQCSTPKNLTALELHAGDRHQRVRRARRHGDPVQPDQDERHGGRPGPAQVGPGDGLPDQPTVRRAGWCARAVRHHAADAGRRDAAVALRHADGRCLKDNTIDVAELCSTQPDILVNGWVVLQDDLHTQPADNVAPIVRDDYLAKVDQASFKKLLE